MSRSPHRTVSHLTESEVRRIARLARLSLAPGEVERMTADLDTVLGYVESLGEVDTEGVPPTAHVLPLETPLRPDEPAPELDPRTAVANAPEASGTAFAVPPVIEGEDEEGPGG
jgi:aspartyl-tRNA(Asn)/glutamyl-tRNA(Gln) amidotransferase subunit C